MTIDNMALTAGLEELRKLAAGRWAEDPLPVGRAASERLIEEINTHELHRQIVDLEINGYCTLPPGKAGSADLIERLKTAMLRREAEVRTDTMGDSGLGATLFHLLPQDPAFEEAVISPVALVLVTYLLGYRAKLSQSTGLIKGKGTPALHLHADHSGKFPAPWSSVANYCVVTWVLTEYTRENGAVCVWPGSHRWGRPVPPELTMAHDHEEIRVLELPAGSLIVWHGSLWHGAVPRTAEGRRMTLALPHVRDAIQPQEFYPGTTTPEMIARNTPRFCTLMGLTSAGPWMTEGPDRERLAMGPMSGSQFD